MSELSAEDKRIETLKWLNNLHAAVCYAGFSSFEFIESLIRWVESGKELTFNQYMGAKNVSKAVSKWFHRANNSDEYEDRMTYGMDGE